MRKEDNIISSAPLYNAITPTPNAQIMFKNTDGQLGYASASDLGIELDTNGLATDVDVTALSASLAAALIIGVGGDTFDKVYATNNGNGTNFKVGDDTWIGDVNLSNTMQVSGVQNAGAGFIKFGSGSATPALGYAGSNYHLSLSASLALQPQATLGSAPVGSLAVSGSHLYFFNGAWVQVV